MPTSLVPIQRALISVSDKAGVVEFARFLAGRGVKLLSTGGTARTLDEAGIAVTEVSAHTGFPEILDGRVKTLHPKIHGGLMARRDLASHREAMTDYGIQPIDLLVASLYPFEETVARGADPESCIENIDVGGPAMIRAAAKNHAFVTVVTDTADYDAVREDMALHAGSTSLTLRRRLAAAAYARTAAYDAAIAAWFAGQQGEPFARNVAIAGRLKLKLRYGENPHQAAALYLTAERRPGAASAEVLQGKELSYNNLVDANAAFELVAEFAEPAAVVVKHANPCGVAVAERLEEALAAARAADPLSAFGGVVALNRPLDAAAAGAIAGQFYEVVIAPEATAEARDVLAAKKNLRLLVTGAMPDAAAACLTGRSVAGGFLLAERDNRLPGELTVVTQRAPTAAEEADLRFAMAVAKHVASNAIVLARGRATVGIGAGQMSRVDSVKAAVRKAAEMAEAAGEGQSRAIGAALASDGFFPFPDGVEAAAAAGVTAVIQPGGSMRDADVIAAADRAGIAMVTTGLRHFRH